MAAFHLIIYGRFCVITKAFADLFASFRQDGLTKRFNAVFACSIEPKHQPDDLTPLRVLYDSAGLPIVHVPIKCPARISESTQGVISPLRCEITAIASPPGRLACAFDFSKSEAIVLWKAGRPAFYRRRSYLRRRKKDWEMYSQLVRPGGMIVFHDIASNYDDTQVKKLWDSIKSDYKYNEYAVHPNGLYGIGVLSK